MKNTLLLLALLLAGCRAQQGFTINGTAEGIAAGRAYLISLEDVNKGDTLLSAPVTDGAFTFTGHVDSTLAVALHVGIAGERAKGINPIFLDNAPLTVHVGRAASTLSPGTPSDVQGGGATQQVYNLYYNLQQARLLQVSNLLHPALDNPDLKDPTALKDTLTRRLANATARGEFWEKQAEEIVNAHPNSPATAFYLHVKYWNADTTEQKAQLARLTGEARTSKYARMLENRIERKRNPVQTNFAPGQLAPDFALPTPSGDALSLHGTPAKVKLVDFWASWCHPCRAENPKVKEIYAAYHAKGLEIIGLSLDTNEKKWLQAIEEDALPWLHVRDQKAVGASTLYGVSYIPFTVLVDENNRIIATNLRGDALAAKIAELLD
ncbi:MAG: AhpC/TSA family protein [Odoribacteraceae bacterium]|jgi:thiol-disulfide isomerase/thioredoxin|nr:AhpC/TSA family protein [Odoribacteraceae bacterium]